MNIWSASRIMKRLNAMIDHAMNGEAIETAYDETKMSALETKLADYLKMNQMGKQQLEAEKRKVNALISDISHQTKTPIANIMLYSQLLAEAGGEENEYINALIAQAEKLNFLIAALMKTSRLESGIITVTPKEQEIERLIKDVAEQCREKALQKNIDLILPKIKSGNIMAVYDLKWTTEALFNIVDNAIKYSGEGSKVCIRVIPYPMFLRIDVADEGIGIAEEEYAKIFSRFYRSQAVATQEGVGLGLFLAREIVSQQKGYIKVASEEGKGTVFSVFLPTGK